MTEFVNHVNKCKNCDRVPEMERKTGGWLIYCPDCGTQSWSDDSIKVIEKWNIYNPEPEKVRA